MFLVGHLKPMFSELANQARRTGNEGTKITRVPLIRLFLTSNVSSLGGTCIKINGLTGMGNSLTNTNASSVETPLLP
jgi:hypothetical protein